MTSSQRLMNEADARLSAAYDNKIIYFFLVNLYSNQNYVAVSYSHHRDSCLLL